MTEALHAKATAGVYAEVINQIYDSLDKRLREAVSNAHDAKATRVHIAVYRQNSEPSRIEILDDGCGMDESDIRNKYICLGGGDNYNNPDTIGRIGIGALSIFALGDTVSITTRKRGTGSVITAILHLSNMKAASKHATPLDQVALGEIASVRDAMDSDDEHFTRIVIEDLSRAAKRLFADEEATNELIETLERILPLSCRGDELLNDRLAPELKERILEERKYRISVICHIPHLGINEMQLFRRTIFAVPDDAQIECIIPIYPWNFTGGADRRLTIYGYLYTNKGGQLPKTWQGINVRVKNVTIVRNTYFEYEEDAAARVRIGGEVFIEHLDENNAIQSNRSGFAVENADYMLIAEYMHEWIASAVREVRKSDEINSLVKKIVKKAEAFHDMCEEICGREDGKAGASTFSALSDPEVTVGAVEPFSLERKLEGELREAGIDAEVIWAPVLASSYYVQRDADDFYTVQVNDRLRQCAFDVGGNTVEFVLGRCGREYPVVTKNGRLVYVNLDSPLLETPDIESLDAGFLEVVCILYLNYLRCDGSAKELYESAISDLSL